MRMYERKGILIRYFWISSGCLSLVLGTVGIILPILPTVPFYMLTVFCFAKGSEKMDRWFKRTSLYKNHLENFVQTGAMTLKAKLKVMLTVTIMMGFAAYLMPSDILIGYFVLALVWIVHVFYFIFGIKTEK